MTGSFTFRPLPNGCLLACLALPLAMSADVVLKPGDSIQAQVDRNPPGTSFLLKSGLYRMQSIEPKSGDTFSGEKGAVLNGAVVVTPFHKEGPLWVASVQVQQIRSVGECGPHSPACNLPEDLFVDNVLVPRAMNVEGAGKGHWYLDYGQSKLYVGDNPDGHEVEMSNTPAPRAPARCTVRSFSAAARRALTGLSRITRSGGITTWVCG